jgi:hypothetical protein
MKTASLAFVGSRFVREAKVPALTCRRERRTGRVGLMGGVTAAVILLMLLMMGCSSESNKPQEPPKPEKKGPELISARSAFQKLYVAAHGWNVDARPYRISSVATSDGNGQDGKWAVWTGSFASPNARAAKTFTWSRSDAQGAPSRGISPSAEYSYSESNASTHIWDMAFLKIDSDQALETAKKHGGDKVLQKAPDTSITYVCDWNHNTNELVWHVLFGPNRENSKLNVAVNASTGEFIRVEK